MTKEQQENCTHDDTEIIDNKTELERCKRCGHEFVDEINEIINKL